MAVMLTLQDIGQPRLGFASFSSQCRTGDTTRRVVAPETVLFSLCVRYHKTQYKARTGE